MISTMELILIASFTIVPTGFTTTIKYIPSYILPKILLLIFFNYIRPWHWFRGSDLWTTLDALRPLSVPLWPATSLVLNYFKWYPMTRSHYLVGCLGKGYGKSKEPLRAYALTFILALTFVLIGILINDKELLYQDVFILHFI